MAGSVNSVDSSYIELHGADREDFHWLDVAKLQFNGQYHHELVDEIKGVYGVFGMLPFMTMYWIVYTAMSSLFYSQGCQMNYNISSSFDFPIAALNDANTAVILVLVPIMDRCIYPFINGPKGCCKFGMLKKIGVGYFIMAAAMVCAGLVEIWRKNSVTLEDTSTCDDKVYISDLNVLWQIPQYLLVGVSEVFASITSLEFFSGQAPERMKSIVYGLSLVVMGAGSLLAALLVVIVNSWTPPWIPSDLDRGYLEYYYFLTAGMMLVTLLVFVPYAQRYQYRPGTDVTNTDVHFQRECDLSSKARVRSQSMNQKA